MADFNAMAETFDTLRRQKRSAVIAAEMLRHITDAHAKTALEYGCGTGLLGMIVQKNFRSFLFMDTSPGMVTRVAAKIARHTEGNLSVVCGTLLDDPVATMRFDYIFSSMVMHHVCDAPSLLRLFFQRLNPGGKLLLVDLDADDGSFHADEPDFTGHHGFDHDWLLRSCAEAGFIQTAVRTFYRGERPVYEKQVPYSLFLLAAEKAMGMQGHDPCGSSGDR